MRTIARAALALACLIACWVAPASAQQLPTSRAFTGRYNPALPTFASGEIGPVTVDANGRLVLSPTSNISIANFPAVQAVSQSGAFTVGLSSGAAVSADLRVAGAANSSGNPIFAQITNFPSVQPVSLASVPLAPGAATIVRAAGTNRSASVTTTASTPMPANTNRQGWKLKNDCAVTVWVNFDGTATAAPGSGNMRVDPGSYLASEPSFVETGAMSVIAASGTCALTVREY